MRKRYPRARCADGKVDVDGSATTGLYAAQGPLGLEPFCAVDLGPCLRMEIAGRTVHTIAVFAPEERDPRRCRSGRPSR
ncbi:MAG: hypothetical protein ACR2LY_06295 [Thermoleophilaceae bacterium]